MTHPADTSMERSEPFPKEMASRGAEVPTQSAAACGPSNHPLAEDPTNGDAQTEEAEAGDFLLTICDGEVLAWISSGLFSCNHSLHSFLLAANMLVSFLAEAVRKEILSFFDDQAVPDLRSTMACTTALEAYIGQVDEALEAEKAAVKEESLKLEYTVDQLMSKLQNIQRPAAAP